MKYIIYQHPKYTSKIDNIVSQIPGFTEPIDIEQWNIRMGVRSWLILLHDETAILTAHEREEGVINIWFAGVVKDKQRTGRFKELLKGLLSIIQWNTVLTMTTRPQQFKVMYELLTRFGNRNKSIEDSEDKVRFTLYGWQLWMAVKNVIGQIRQILPYIALIVILKKLNFQIY